MTYINLEDPLWIKFFTFFLGLRLYFWCKILYYSFLNNFFLGHLTVF